jgi:hypothetical protein
VAARYGGGLLVVVHIRAPQQPRLGASRKLLRELAALEKAKEPALAVKAKGLKLFLEGYPTEEVCAVAGLTPKKLWGMAAQVRKMGVATLVRTYGSRLRRGMSAELRAELGVVAEEANLEGRVARAVCLYVDGVEPEAALAEAGIPRLDLQYLADCVRDRGIAYLRHRFRNGRGWRKQFDSAEGGPRKRRSERGLAASSGEGSRAAAAQPPPEPAALTSTNDTATPRPRNSRWRDGFVGRPGGDLKDTPRRPGSAVSAV